MTGEASILTHRDGARLDIVLNRPANRNSITPEMMTAFYEAVLDASRDRDLRIVMVRGAGKDFCPGADLHFYATPEASSPENRTPVEHYRVATLLHAMPAVTVAAIRGGCAGAGLGWAAACDLRIADTSARFNTAFLNLGVAGDMGGVWSLGRLLGAGRARDLFLMPDKFDAMAALDMGLLSRLFSPEAFDAELEAIVARLLAVAPQALLAIKNNFVISERVDFATYVDWESMRHDALFNGEEARAAFAAHGGSPS